jgi:prepilin-type N-terminal cleavage/methylation domain-containing protein
MPLAHDRRQRQVASESPVRQPRNDEGFTLIEVLIVIIVLAVLVAIVVFAVGTTSANAVGASCRSDAKTVESALEAYKVQHAFGYPTPASPTDYSPLTGTDSAGALGSERPPHRRTTSWPTTPAATSGCRLRAGWSLTTPPTTTTWHRTPATCPRRSRWQGTQALGGDMKGRQHQTRGLRIRTHPEQPEVFLAVTDAWEPDAVPVIPTPMALAYWAHPARVQPRQPRRATHRRIGTTASA